MVSTSVYDWTRGTLSSAQAAKRLALVRLWIWVLAGICLAAGGAEAWAAERSMVQRAAFKRANLCPATGRAAGPCPGFVVDHVVPLCAGGADHPSNMQWQTVADAAVKDREEKRSCAIYRGMRGLPK